MIPSKGNNQFKDNEFDFWTRSAPILQTQEEVVAKVEETLGFRMKQCVECYNVRMSRLLPMIVRLDGRALPFLDKADELCQAV